MSNLKFYGAYCKCNNKVLSIKEILDLPNSDYKNNLFCPFCKQAKLSLINTNKIIYLRTYKKQEHAEYCTLAQDNIDNKVLTEYLLDNSKREEVIDKLNKFAQDIFNKPHMAIEAISASIDIKEENILSSGINNNKTVNKKYIPRQNITNGFLVQELGIYKFYYGELYLSWYGPSFKNKGGYRKILAFTLHNTKNSIFSITMSSSVSEYLKEKLPYNDYTIQKVKFAIVAELQIYNNRYRFSIPHSSYLVCV